MIKKARASTSGICMYTEDDIITERNSIADELDSLKKLVLIENHNTKQRCKCKFCTAFMRIDKLAKEVRSE